MFAAASLTVTYMIPVFVFAFGALYVASVKYDIMDALKLGIDKAIYKHAVVAEKYFSDKVQIKNAEAPPSENDKVE